MNNNNNFDDYSIPPKNINMQHMPVIIVCDTSGSMGRCGGTPIKNVNLAVNRFANDVCNNPKASECVDIAVLSFNDEPTVVQGFRPITELQPVQFTAGGGTNISAALNMAISKLRERCRLYDEIGIEIMMPSIILITDGDGGDVTEIAETIKKRTADKKMQLWVFAVNDYDKETVAKLTDEKRVFEMVDETDFDFMAFYTINAVCTTFPNIPIYRENPLVKEKTNLKVPDLDEWLNN